MERQPSVPAKDDVEMVSSSGTNPHGSDKLSIFERQEPLFNLIVRTFSWPTEGRGLLHILSPLLFSKDFKVRAASGAYFLSCGESHVELLNTVASDSSECDTIVARLDVSGTGVTLDASNSWAEGMTENGGNMCMNEVWEDISKESNGKEIRAGDILRFGSYKVKLVDVQLQIDNETNSALASTGLLPLKPFLRDGYEDASERASSFNGSENAAGPVCRICFEPALSPDEEPMNPLVSPCLCSGSLRYIHVQCLRRWLDGQLQVKQFENGGGSYFIRTILCEICRSEYSKSVYRSILISRPKVPHIILEELLGENASERDDLRSPPSLPISRVHIIPVSPDRPIRLGRSKDNDVQLCDISVSRFHAYIRFNLEKKQVRLVDLQSKFGSLVRLPNKIFIPAKQSSILRVQIGPCLIEIALSFPNKAEKFIPERFLQHKGSIKVLKTKSPPDYMVEAQKQKSRRPRSSSTASPVSPAATLDRSAARSPPAIGDSPIEQSPSSNNIVLSA